MKVTVTDRVEKAILKSLFDQYDKCENCGEKMPEDDPAWYQVDIVPAISGGMSDMICPKCGHKHVESFQFDYLPTLQKALAEENSQALKAQINTPSMRSRRVSAPTPTTKPSSVADVAMNRLKKRKGGR